METESEDFLTQEINLPKCYVSKNAWMWWLILCVNLRGSWVSRIRFNIILLVTVRVFQDDIDFWISRLRKEDCPPPHEGDPHPIHWRPE